MQHLYRICKGCQTEYWWVINARYEIEKKDICNDEFCSSCYPTHKKAYDEYLNQIGKLKKIKDYFWIEENSYTIEQIKREWNEERSDQVLRFRRVTLDSSSLYDVKNRSFICWTSPDLVGTKVVVDLKSDVIEAYFGKMNGKPYYKNLKEPISDAKKLIDEFQKKREEIEKAHQKKAPMNWTLDSAIALRDLKPMDEDAIYSFVQERMKDEKTEL